MANYQNETNWQKRNENINEGLKLSTVDKSDDLKVGDNHFTVKGTIEFEIQVYDVEDKDDAKLVANSLEAKLSPWALETSDLIEQEIEIGEVEVYEDE